MEQRINLAWRSRVNANIGNLLSKTNISPNVLTFVGILVSIFAAWLIIQYGLVAGAFIMLASSCFDLLDGAVARAANKTTKFGAFFDEVSDRVGESCYFSAIFLLVPEFSVFLAAATSILVSYVKLSAERRGFKILSGSVSGRPVRVAMLLILMLISPLVGISQTIWLITILNIFTILMRINEVKNQG